MEIKKQRSMDSGRESAVRDQEFDKNVVHLLQHLEIKDREYESLVFSSLSFSSESEPNIFSVSS